MNTSLHVSTIHRPYFENSLGNKSVRTYSNPWCKYQRKKHSMEQGTGIETLDLAIMEAMA